MSRLALCQSDHGISEIKYVFNWCLISQHSVWGAAGCISALYFISLAQWCVLSFFFFFILNVIYIRSFFLCCCVTVSLMLGLRFIFFFARRKITVLIKFAFNVWPVTAVFQTVIWHLTEGHFIVQSATKWPKSPRGIRWYKTLVLRTVIPDHTLFILLWRTAISQGLWLLSDLRSPPV